MKATRPQRGSVSTLSHREAEKTPVETAPELAALAAAALGQLARDGKGSPETGWSLEATGPDGVPMTIACTGPDLPASVPQLTAHPSVIPLERPWVGTHRLTLRAPLIVLDLYWRPDAPLRIMTFSRGDWEKALLALAA